MSLAVAIQMDPVEAIDIDADSTFVLALEAQRRPGLDAMLKDAAWHEFDMIAPGSTRANDRRLLRRAGQARRMRRPVRAGCLGRRYCRQRA